MRTRLLQGTTILSLVLAATAGCGGGSAGEGDDLAPRLAGSSWVGQGTFEQVIGAETTKVTMAVRLEFDAQGVPLSLPSLGMISPWRLYVARQGEPDPSPAEPLAQGGSVWAYCPFEADGAANELRLEQGTRVSGPGSTGWMYRAGYRFTDLTDYSLYDYTAPDAPQVSMQASDLYRLSGSGTSERLTVEGRASGVHTGTAQAITLRLDAQLERGEEVTDELFCQLGARRR